MQTQQYIHTIDWSYNPLHSSLVLKSLRDYGLQFDTSITTDLVFNKIQKNTIFQYWPITKINLHNLWPNPSCITIQLHTVDWKHNLTHNQTIAWQPPRNHSSGIFQQYLAKTASILSQPHSQLLSKVILNNGPFSLLDNGMYQPLEPPRIRP